MMYTTMEEVYRWEIKDIPSKLAASPGKHFSEDSQKFPMGVDSYWQLALRCWKGRHDRQDKPQLKIYLINCLSGSNQQTVMDKEQFHLRVENNYIRNVVIQGSPGSTFADDNGRTVYVWNDILEFGKEESFDAEEFLRGSVITTVMLKKKTASIAKTAATGDICVKEINKEKFYGMIAKLENDEKYSDVKIISSDGREFYAHRWILSEVSDVFKAIFISDMAGKEAGVVKFEGLSGATVKLLLHFVYTQKIGQEWSTPGIVEELACAADKYQLEDLKEFFNANLGKVCTAENAGNLLALAEITSMRKAVADILAFIREKCIDPKGFFDILKNTKMN